MAGKPGRSGRLPDINGKLDLSESSDVLSFPSGAIPEKPAFVDREASGFWDLIVAELGPLGRLKPEYVPLLQATCEMWGLYRASYVAAHRNPTDKDCRISVTAYWAKFEQGAARFGLNPVDIARIKNANRQQAGVRRRQA